MSPDMACLESVSLSARGITEPKTARSQSHSFYCAPLSVFAQLLQHRWIALPEYRVSAGVPFL